MFYYIFEYLRDYLNMPGGMLFEYVSFRAIIAGVISLLIAVIGGKYFINFMKRKKIYETQRDEKVDPFNTKKVGVPTMGGLVVIIAILGACLLVGKLHNIYLVLLIITTLILGVVGFADDYIKTFKKNKEGLNGWWKVLGQVVLGLIIGLTLRYSPATIINERVDVTYDKGIELVTKSQPVKSTQTTIPFVNNHNLNYADIFDFLGSPLKYRFGWIFFVLLTVLVVTAVSNGTNLNDGMDGMAAGNSAIVAIALIVLSYASSNYIWADYFDIMYIPGSEEIVVFLAAFVGALIGFLWYNSYPAQMFMGDTGSLTIGGIIGVSAVIIHKELLLPLLCGVFFMESLSVILQRTYYKMGKRRGVHQRLWKRTPFHDHFRTSIETMQKSDPGSIVRFKGSNELHFETKITFRFWIISFVLVALTILTLKIR